MSSNNKHKKLNDAEEQPMESESESESSEDDEMYNANEVSSLLLIRRFRHFVKFNSECFHRKSKWNSKDGIQ